jgi:hypothetical protein
LLWVRWTKPVLTRRASLISVVLLFVACCCTSCGGGLQGNGSIVGTGSPGTPAGTYNLQVTVATTSITHSAQVKLTITQ